MEKMWKELNPKEIKTNKEAYNLLMDKFVPKMAGEEQSKKMSTAKNPVEWVTVAQIAFVLISIENYEEIANRVAAEGGKLTGEKGKFTVKGNKKRCGYSVVGIDRHKEIIQELGDWWKKEKAAIDSDQESFGKAYLAKKKKEQEEMASGGGKRVLGGEDGEGPQNSSSCDDMYGYLEDMSVPTDMMEV